MRRRTLRHATLGLCALVLAGALPASATDLPYSEVFDHTYPLAAGGRVGLENINGDVRIEVGDRNEVRVHAVKQADSKSWLDAVSIEVDTDHNAVRIKTRMPQTGWNEHHESRVEYTLTVPRSAELDGVELVNGDLSVTGVQGGVQVHTVNGTIHARDLAGDIELSTVNGTVEATLDPTASSDRIKATSVNGGVRLTLPRSVSAELRAKTVNGRITNGFGLKVNEHRFVGADLTGTLGVGGASVQLRTVNGSIDIQPI